MSYTQKFFSTLLLAFSIFVILSTQAYAQQNQEIRQYKFSEDMEFNLPPPSQIEQRHLQEMNKVYLKCMADGFMSSHRDCKCYGMAYLEARLRTPSVEPAVVETAVQNVCYSTDMMTGYYFNQCVNNIDLGSIDVRRKDPVGLCECFGQTVAKSFPSMRRVDFRILNRMKTNAYTECGFFE